MQTEAQANGRQVHWLKFCLVLNGERGGGRCLGKWVALEHIRMFCLHTLLLTLLLLNLCKVNQIQAINSAICRILTLALNEQVWIWELFQVTQRESIFFNNVDTFQMVVAMKIVINCLANNEKWLKRAALFSCDYNMCVNFFSQRKV